MNILILIYQLDKWNLAELSNLCEITIQQVFIDDTQIRY